MNKEQQRRIKLFCSLTFDEAIGRFGTKDRYERFVRRFYNRTKRYPTPSNWGKRHGKNDWTYKPLRQKWHEKWGWRAKRRKRAQQRTDS